MIRAAAISSGDTRGDGPVMTGGAIYRGYDQAALDKQYNNQQRVPNFAEHVARWQKESADLRTERPAGLDIPFGPSSDEILDIFTPDKAQGPAPVQVFIHGGYWRAFQARDFDFIARTVTAAGALAVVINYALVPAVRMAELVRQCRAALAWVQASIAGYGGDPQRIYISGHSAGGHLVAMMAAVAPQPGEPDTRGMIKAGVAISGLYDLEPIRLSYLQETLKLSEAEVAAYSPQLHPPARSVPLLLAYGSAESEEFARHATEYGRLLRERGVACEVRALDGYNHMSICSAFADPKSEPSQLILRQMGLG
jgi:arylformamidase